MRRTRTRHTRCGHGKAKQGARRELKCQTPAAGRSTSRGQGGQAMVQGCAVRVGAVSTRQRVAGTRRGRGERWAWGFEGHPLCVGPAARTSLLLLVHVTTPGGGVQQLVLCCTTARGRSQPRLQQKHNKPKMVVSSRLMARCHSCSGSAHTKKQMLVSSFVLLLPTTPPEVHDAQQRKKAVSSSCWARFSLWPATAPQSRLHPNA